MNKRTSIRIKTLGLSILFALLVWIFDTFLDYFVFSVHKGTLAELIILEISTHELYMRSIIFAFFIIFGLVLSNSIIKLQLSEEKTKQLNAELVVSNEELEATIEELEASNEELEASNEELEAINEELISAERKIESSEARYYTLFSEMIDGYAIHELIYSDSGKPIDYRFLDINPAFEKMTGLKREIVGKTAKQAIPELEDFWIETYGKVVLTGESSRFENYAAPLDKWFEVSAFKSGEGQFTCIFADITEKIKAQEALKESYEDLEHRVEERTAQLNASNEELRTEIHEREQVEKQLALYKKFVEASEEGMGWADLEGLVRYLNPALCRMLEMDRPEEFYGQPVAQFYDEETQRRLAEEIFPTILQKGYWSGDLTLYSIKGKGRPTQNSLIVLRDENGNPLSFANVVTDLTERKRAEEELKRHRDHLEELVELRTTNLQVTNKELEQIIYITSHDLRSPLVNVQGYSKELEMLITNLSSKIDTKSIGKIDTDISDLLQKEIPESLGYILNSTNKMDSLLSGLLKLSRSGRAILSITELNMNELMADVISNFEFQVKKSGIKIKVSDLPPCLGDMVQINQVFSNLLDNAIKYIDPDRPGEIAISGNAEGANSIYCIEDNGIGIAAGDQESIFEIFNRLPTASVNGEGLGLTIVQRILVRHHGNIRVESTPGKGSSFYITVPNQ